METISPSRGPVGTMVTITGKDLGEITRILFNCTQTTFSNKSTTTTSSNSGGGAPVPTTVVATVPAGASSGPVEGYTNSTFYVSNNSTTGGPVFTVTAAHTVTTAAATAVVGTSATLGGNVTADGNETVTERGVVYVAGTGTPTTANTKVVMGTGTGSFSQSVTGLTAGITYSVRAYALNSVGTGYGPVQTFATAPAASLNCPVNNALNFDGTDDHVRGTAPLPTMSAMTLEGWVYQEANGGFRTLLNGDNFPAGAVHIHMTNGTMQFTVNGSGPADYLASTGVPLNTWAHVAVVCSSTGGAGGTNTTQTTLTDDSGSGRTGTLTGFALTTGTQSNYVTGNSLDEVFTLASFAPTSGVVRQTITLTGTGFTGVTGVSFNGTAATAFTVVNNTTITATVPAGATSGTLRVSKACGTVANASVFTVCAAPVAVAQNVTVNLDANGNATVAAPAVNNGSTANCGAAAAGALNLVGTTELVVNGTFDTNAASWTLTNGTSYTSTGGNPGGYLWLNASGEPGTDPTATQTLTGLTVGTTYYLSGSYRNVANCCGAGSGAIAFGIDISGSQVATLPDPGLNWTPFGLAFTATATSQKLAFRAEINGTDVDIAIDNISVRALVSSLSYTCANTRANPVTLTVTDAGGNTSTATATVTVTDNTAPVAYVLPPAPALAITNVPEAAGYGVLYQLDVASFNSLTSVPYLVNRSGEALARPARVAYFMELSDGVSTKWVWASMDNFATTLAQLGLPNPTANNVVWNQNVANLNVAASANAGVTTGNNVGVGRLEMWRSNYSASNASAVPNASETLYDFGDRPDGNANYASFQVHNVTGQQTLLAYNNWGGNGGGGIGNIGIGNQVGGSGHPDWTFAYNANTYTVKRITILVTKAETSSTASFTQPATVVLDASCNATVTSALVYNGNAIDNCGSVTATVSPSSFTCANVGANTVTVTLNDGNGNTRSQTATVTVTAPATPTTTWSGSASTNWTDCANWSFGKVPDATTSVVVPAGLSRYPTLTTGTLTVKDLTIDVSGSFTLNGGAVLQVSGNLTNNGTATFSGTVAFVGSAPTQTLSNNGAFTTVTVTKPSGTVQLGQNLTINSALTLSSGTLTTTSAYQVNLGGSASLSESETSYVLGKVAVNRTLVPGTAQSFGGLGLTLTPAAGSVAPGATAVSRVTGTALTGIGTSVSIKRYFDIQPATNTGLNVTMDFAYFDHELNGIPAANPALFKSVTTTAGPWASQAPITRNANLVTKTGIADFSIWTLGNSANPLPVELIAFTATAEGLQAVRLGWTTASEKNSAYFDVERSLDGRTFAAIGQVAAAGTSSARRSYTLLDGQLPAGATLLYYRLRQVDADGTTAFSSVQTVTRAAMTTRLTLASNPTSSMATLAGATPGVAVLVLDAVGRPVHTATADANGTVVLTLPAGLPRGVYVLRSGAQALRLVLE